MSEFSERVLRWQREHGRHGLPWQATRDPYRVWLSEIMLQQTQVSTVLGYYERFLDRFPTVADLAAAPQADVLALWSGLGYYARARNLHRCAQAVRDDHGGRFPSDAAGLAELPGIGRSTAAAIAAFCFGQRVAILDGNVKRVLARHLGWERDLAQAASERALWDIATERLPSAPTGPSLHDAMVGYTQGLMDLGAEVCTVRRPACDACPVRIDCVARISGEPERLPIKTRKLRRGQRAAALLWLQWRDRVWLVHRPDGGVWGHLWSLPEFPTAAALEQAVVQWPGTLEWRAPFKHVLTHFDWQLQPLRLDWHGDPGAHHQAEIDALPAITGAPRDAPSGPASGRWVRRDELHTLGLPAPIRKLLEESP